MTETLNRQINALTAKQNELEEQKRALYPAYYKTEFTDEFFDDLEQSYPNLKGKIARVDFTTDNIYDDEGRYDLTVVDVSLTDVQGQTIELNEEGQYEGYTKYDMSETICEYLHDSDIDTIEEYTDHIINRRL